MADVRSNLGYIIGSVIAGAGVFVSWFFESGLLATVVGIIIGAIVAFWAQIRTQKIAWKREYSIKSVELVYSPLYGLIKDLIANRERKEYVKQGFIQWGEMQKDYRYFMVDKPFREKLDNIYERVEKFDMACYKLNIEVIPSILKSAIEEVFHYKTAVTPRLSIDYETHNRPNSYPLDIVPELRKLTNLSDLLEEKKQYLEGSEITNVRFSIVYSKPPLTPRPLGFKENQQKINDYWDLCRKKLKENETYKFVVDKNDKLLEEARQIRKELIKRIEEPWKI